MKESKNPLHLRPEAQPISNWHQLHPQQRIAMVTLVEMLTEALDRTTESNRSHPKLPWLFNETRSQLAFIDGQRGTGKTTLMTTLAAAIVDPNGFDLEVDPGSDATSASPILQLPKRQELRQHLLGLQDRIVFVQPLEMEGLPENTPLLAAILARIQRAVELRSGRRELDGRDREAVRLNQFIVRISSSLDSNLQQRRGALDRQQFGDAVLEEEKHRLELPTDLDEVLRQLSDRLAPEAQRSGTKSNQPGRMLIVVPIDDVDLNPQRCMELLRLLRTYSPPRELFFLLMGQFSLVEDIVRLSMSADFGRIKKETAELDPSKQKQLDDRISDVAVSNLRKMIPPSQRIQLEDSLAVKDVLEFRILDSKAETRPSQLRDLFQRIQLMTRQGRRCQFGSFADLLACSSRDWSMPIDAVQANLLGWNHYPAFGMYQVTPRRLADVWIEFNRLATEADELTVETPPRKGQDQSRLARCRDLDFNDLSKPRSPTGSAQAQYVELLWQTVGKHYRRSMEADPDLSSEDSDRFATKNAVRPIPRRPKDPRFSHDLLIVGEEIEVEVRTSGGVMQKRTYAPRLRFLDLKAVSAIPEFAFDADKSSSPPFINWESSNDHITRIDEPRSRLAIVLHHDIADLIEDDRMTLGDAPVLTSVEPVRMTWVGPEGEVIAYPWPVPPLRTFASTSLFLGITCCKGISLPRGRRPTRRQRSQARRHDWNSWSIN